LDKIETHRFDGKELALLKNILGYVPEHAAFILENDDEQYILFFLINI